MKFIKKKWFRIALIAVFAVVMAALLYCRNADFFAHCIGHYDTDLNNLEPINWEKIEINGKTVNFMKGGYPNRNLWTKDFDVEIDGYFAHPVLDVYDAVNIATNIKNNCIRSEEDNYDDLVLGGVFYDVRYDVWTVWFIPSWYTDNIVGTDFSITFRGFNGRLLFVGWLG